MRRSSPSRAARPSTPTPLSIHHCEQTSSASAGRFWRAPHHP
ncbi:MAG: hypothetical protein LH471_00485 [Salinibacterium sp.]|nr:hypothetical protein [Salinibacterium sp.]